MTAKRLLSWFLAALLILAGALSAVSCGSEAPGQPDDTTAAGDTTAEPGTDAPGTSVTAETEPADDRPENKKTVYVASDADENAADGSEEHPFATLEAARDAVRAIERTDDLTGIDVIVRGTFFRRDTFVLDDASDSGSKLCPVRWIGEDDAGISGGIVIDASELAPVADSDPLYDRLDPEARDRIVSFDLKTRGVTEADVACGDMSPYQSTANAVVYAGNERLHLARYPDGKFAFISSYEPDEAGNYRFKYTSIHNIRIQEWKEPDRAFVAGYFTVYWSQDRSRALSFDFEESVMTLANSNGYEPKKGMVFYWYNIPEELTEAGEYYISPDAVLYAILPEGAQTLTYPVASDRLLSVKGDYLTLDHLTFRDSREDMIKMDGDHLTVTDCLFERGGYAAAGMNGDHAVFENNEVGHMTYGGLKMSGGNPDTLTDSGNRVCNNYFHDFSEGLATYCAAVSISGCGITVSHNEIAHSNHDALSWNGHNHVIEYNEFYDICNYTDDAGVCYAGRTFDWYGNTFRYNYFHEVGSDSLAEEAGGGCGGHGIYYDDGLGGQNAYGNIFENFWFGDAFAIGGGPDHVVEDNLFINCSTCIGYDDREYAAFVIRGEASHPLLDAVYDKYHASDLLADAFPTIVRMKKDVDLKDPWFWAAPARSSIKGNVAYCAKENESTQYTIADSVKEFSTVENNTVRVYEDGAQPSVRDALRESGLDIPFDEIGRICD